MKKTIIRCIAFNSFLKDYADNIEYINCSVSIKCGLPTYKIDLKMSDTIFPKPLKLLIGNLNIDYFCDFQVILGSRVLLGGSCSTSIYNLKELLDPMFWVNPTNVIDSVSNEDLRRILENDVEEFNLKHSEVEISDDTKTVIRFNLTSSFIIATINSDIWEIGYYYPGTKQVRRKMLINKNNSALSRIVGV